MPAISLPKPPKVGSDILKVVMFILSFGGTLIVYLDNKGSFGEDNLMQAIIFLFSLVGILFLVYMVLVHRQGYAGNENELAIARSLHRSALQDEKERAHREARKRREASLPANLRGGN